MNQKIILGRIIAIIGLIRLIINAINYFTNSNWNSPYAGTGLILSVIGAILIKKGKSQNN